MEFYNRESDDILKNFDSNEKEGLTSLKVEEQLKQFGPNKLKEGEKKSFISRVKDQFNDFLIIILIIASIISFITGNKVDSIVIIAIVLINAGLGIYQEQKAENALDALKDMAAPETTVVRDGKIQEIESQALVPGDLVLLETGDIVPADMRIIDSQNLKIDESSLTGESLATEKNSSVIKGDIGLGDRHNMAYMSTIVTYGRCKGIVVATGHNTEIGKIATIIQAADKETTPLQEKLNQLGKYIGIICLVLCIIVFAIGVAQGREVLDMFMVAVSLAVAAIPEGLPAIVTIVLSLGMTKMVKRNAIVKKLLAVETLGSTTVICSDKTGTLTKNEMTVVKILNNGEILDVSGSGYNPEGEFLKDQSPIEFNNLTKNTFFTIASLCNDSILTKKDGTYSIIGDPTEGALLVLSEKAGFKKNNLQKLYPRTDEIPFDSTRKMMTTVHENYFPNKIASFTKGAPDIVLNKCNQIIINDKIEILDDKLKKKIEEINGKMANSALRVLALAMNMNEGNYQLEDLEDNMIFVGLVGMIDPPRLEVKESIQLCDSAGIKTVMITGDYKDTAFAIAKELGIADSPEQAIMGQELDKYTDVQLRNLVKSKRVYARVSPQHKVRIIEALKANGEIVAMTGDGVNDAMALKKADIGVAMGITGTDVAKNTADVILTDDNFSSIVRAVEEGRVIYNNIKRFVSFLLSCNFGEILIIFTSILFGLPVPLLPIQLLWLNLITDSLPALALGVEKGHKGIMEEKPRDPQEAILDRETSKLIAVQSISIAIASLAAYLVALNKFSTANNYMIQRTITFSTIVTAELLRAYSSRSSKKTILEIGVFSNSNLNKATLISFALLLGVIYIPFLRPIFHTQALDLNSWIIVIGFSIIPLVTGELFKKFR